MKKVILILFFTLFLTGCTVNYNLEIKNDKIVENINGEISNLEIKRQDNSTGLNVYRDILYNEQNALLDKDSLYKKNIIENDDSVEFDFNYTYVNNYDKSRIINRCFEHHIIEKEDNLYYIRLFGDFYCLNSDKITINVTSDYMILENNANKVNNNTYTWIINNEKDNDIYLTVSENVKYENTKSTKKISTFQIIGLIVFVILSLITYLLYKKKNSGKI